MASPSVAEYLARIIDVNSKTFFQALCLSCLRDSHYSVTLADPNLPDCPLVGVSKGFEKMTGYSWSDVVGHNCRFLGRACPVLQETRRAIRVAIRNLTHFFGVLVNRRKNGEVFQNLLHLHSLRVGNTRFMLGVQADITHDTANCEHVRDLSWIVEEVCASIDAWTRLQNPLKLPLSPQGFLRSGNLVALSDDEELEGRVSCSNTFLHVCGERGSLLNRMRRSLSEPAVGKDRRDLKVLPADVLRCSAFQIRLGGAPLHESPLSGLSSAGFPVQRGCGHPLHCTPCSFHCYSLQGCVKGAACSYCHEDHPKKTRRRGKKKKFV